MKQKNRRAARRMKRGRAHAALRAAHAAVQCKSTAFLSRFPYIEILPGQRYDGDVEDFIARIGAFALVRDEHDAWLVEYVGIGNYAHMGAWVGFNDPNHAFAYRMRWC